MLRLTEARTDAVKAIGVPLARAVEGIDLWLARANRQGLEARPAKAAAGCADQAA
jgi:hypothetical protein